MQHMEKLSETMGNAIRKELAASEALTAEKRSNSAKEVASLMLFMVGGMEGTLGTNPKGQFAISLEDDLDPRRILAPLSSGPLREQLFRHWGRFLTALIRRQKALLELPLPPDAKPNTRTMPADHLAASKASGPAAPDEESPEAVDPETDRRFIQLIQASTTFNIPKSTLSKAIRKSPGSPGSLHHVRKGRQIYFYIEEVKHFAKMREAYRRRRPPGWA
jgi:hypothetical protein